MYLSSEICRGIFLVGKKKKKKEWLALFDMNLSPRVGCMIAWVPKVGRFRWSASVPNVNKLTNKPIYRYLDTYSYLIQLPGGTLFSFRNLADQFES